MRQTFHLIAFFSLASTTANLFADQTNTATTVSATELDISSISVESTNLSLVASIPPGLDQVALEISASLDGEWEEAGPVDVPTGTKQLTFTLPKPATPTAFFRLKAKRHLEATPLLSSELQYVAMPSLAANLSDTGDALFGFKGLVDGSDKIVITRDGALWNHINWGWPPDAISINDTQWKPQEKNYVTTTGTSKFLPETFSLDSVSLETIQGRDIIALERSTNALIVYLNDTPIGPGEYEFNIHFHPVGRASPRADELVGRADSPVRVAPRAVVTEGPHLKIAARIDGSDCLTVTPSQATWEHKFHACPTSVTLNDILWNPKKHKTLKNEGTNTFLPAGVDPSTAKIVSRKGRHLATLWADHDSLKIYFADNPNGDDSYELEISFGQ